MNDFEITREKIIIRTRPLKNGNQSIYLEMHHEGKRSTECLHLFLVPEETGGEAFKDNIQMAVAILQHQHQVRLSKIHPVRQLSFVFFCRDSG